MADRFHFGVEDCKIAAWTATGSYGTLYDVVAINNVSFELQTTSAQLEGDDKVVDVHARQTVAQIVFQFAFSDRLVYSVMTGGVNTTISSTDYTTFSNENRPYFGLGAKVDLTNAVGNDVIFVPKLKIMESFNIATQYGQYVTPQVTAQGVADGVYGIVQDYEYATAQAITALPPVII